MLVPFKLTDLKSEWCQNPDVGRPGTNGLGDSFLDEPSDECTFATGCIVHTHVNSHMGSGVTGGSYCSYLHIPPSNFRALHFPLNDLHLLISRNFTVYQLKVALSIGHLVFCFFHNPCILNEAKIGISVECM